METSPFYLVVLPIWFDGATIEAGVTAADQLPAEKLASWESHHMIEPAADPNPPVEE